MAGDWIKVEHATPDKPEMVQMADSLNIDQDAVVGKCLRLWIWADQQSVDGDDLSVTNAFIDRFVFCPGFAKALAKVGWLDGREGRLSIPNFARHNGESAKKRALSKNRNQKLRNKRHERDAPSVTDASPEKRREEKSISEREGGGKIPKSLDTIAFREKWKLYVDWWLMTSGTQLNAIQADLQLQDLCRRGHDKAIADLTLTMTNATKTGTIWDSSRASTKPSTNGKSRLEKVKEMLAEKSRMREAGSESN